MNEPARGCPMSDRDAFLRAICASPDDDTPRLVFADWLEERGTAAEVAWAEFIRLQCEAERLPPEDERVGDLEFRAEGLAAAFEREWLGEWAERLVNWSFRRGFLDGVVIEPRPFLRYGGSLFERHPLLRRVRFVGPDGRGVPDEAVGELAALPHLARVRALDLSGDRTDGPAWARALARATHLTGLEELDLSETSPDGRGALDPGDLRRLADAPHLGSLRRLRIGTVYSEALGPDAINRIAAAPFARHLEALNLDGHGIGDEGCRRLARNPVFQGLRSLSLDRAQRITQAGVRDLIESPHLDRLTHLNIAGVQLDVPELARLPGLARLERLGLCFSGAEAPARHWAAFAASPYVSRLTSLRLTDRMVDAEALRVLANSPNLPRLRELALPRNNTLGDDGVKALVASPLMGRLIALDLRGCGIRAPGLTALARSPHLARLRVLNLSENYDIGPPDELAHSPDLTTRLRRLGLMYCSFDARAVEVLAASPALAGLTALDLGGNELNHRAVRALVTSPHLRRLTSLDLRSSIHQPGLDLLAGPDMLPRLRDLLVGWGPLPDTVTALRKRFGPRLHADEAE